MSYIRLAKAKHTTLRSTIEADCVHMYVAAVDEDLELIHTEQLENAEKVTVECVAVIGNEQRCFAKQAVAYEDTNGMMWLAENDYEEVFA